MLLLFINTVGPVATLMLVSLFVFLVFGLISPSISGSYLDKHSTGAEMTFLRPWHVSVVSISGAIMFVLLGLFPITLAPRIPLSIAIPTLVLFLPLGIFWLFSSVGPNTLTLNLIDNTYLRRSGWKSTVTQGSLSDISGITVESGGKGSDLVFLRQKSNPSNRTLIVGQFFGRPKDANDLAQFMSDKLKVPINRQ